MTGDWRPLSAREGRREEYESLAPGIPAWLRQSILDWVGTVVGASPNLYLFLQEVERKCRISLSWTQGQRSALTSLQAMIDENEDGYLDVVDFLLSGPQGGAISSVLGHLLEQGGSLFHVVERDGVWMLERRVGSEVAAGAERAIAGGGRAGDHLGRAWHEVYGREPSPSAAYREAVRAVEAAAKPVVEPSNQQATLGTMIRVLDDHQADFSLALQPTRGNSIETLLEMMRVLWKSQLDRHGTDDESVPIEVSKDEAETALHLAITLVHWFTSGAVTRA